MKKNEIFELIEKFQDTNISLLEYEDSQGRLRLEKGLDGTEGVTGSKKSQRVCFKSGDINEPLADDKGNMFLSDEEKGFGVEKQEEKENAAGEIIKAPLVGVFYRAANPDSKPFAEIGKEVKKGEPLCIIEAMKVMNEIRASYDLIVKNIMGIDGEMVDCATEIFEVERC